MSKEVDQEIYQAVYDAVLQLIILEGMYSIDLEDDSNLEAISKALQDLSKTITDMAKE